MGIMQKCPQHYYKKNGILPYDSFLFYSPLAISNLISPPNLELQYV